MGDVNDGVDERPVLAATVHDPHGHYLAGLARLSAVLRRTFVGFGVFATDETSPQVVAFLEHELGATVSRDAADPASIGKHRRQAVRLASTLDPTLVLYADLDHVLRWIEADPDELRLHLTQLPADFVLIGRTVKAMEACPRRLRDTETIVNHIYRLATGRDWDLMFAVRAMTPQAAAVVVEHAREDTIANDVEWPSVVERAGLTIDYRAADGLSYRITQDFEAEADAHDHDPAAWIARVEIAHLQLNVLQRILDSGT